MATKEEIQAELDDANARLARIDARQHAAEGLGRRYQTLVDKQKQWFRASRDPNLANPNAETIRSDVQAEFERTAQDLRDLGAEDLAADFSTPLEGDSIEELLAHVGDRVDRMYRAAQALNARND
jgi:multidrug efflux pump subunit AcrA (membrane-fusion protein)